MDDETKRMLAATPAEFEAALLDSTAALRRLAGEFAASDVEFKRKAALISAEADRIIARYQP